MKKTKRQTLPARRRSLTVGSSGSWLGERRTVTPCTKRTSSDRASKSSPFPRANSSKCLSQTLVIARFVIFSRDEGNTSDCVLQNYGEGQTAAEYINGAFNGQRGFKDCENCDTCGQEGAEKKCSNCKGADYCNQVSIHFIQTLKLCLTFLPRLQITWTLMFFHKQAHSYSLRGTDRPKNKLAKSSL